MNDPKVRLVEVDVDTTAYDQGHVPGAVGWNWTTQLCDTLVRDIIPKDELEELLATSGHRQRHHDRPLRRQQQLVRRLGVLAAEDLRPRGRAAHERRPQEVAGRGPRADRPRRRRSRRSQLQGERRPTPSLRAFLPEVQAGRQAARRRRWSTCAAPTEFTGEILAPPGLPETCQRGGHIPGAASIPWGKAVQRGRHVQERRRAEGALRRRGRRPATSRSSPTAASASARATPGSCSSTCSATTNVKNYDGSWTEWGNLVGAPVERGAGAGA